MQRFFRQSAQDPVGNCLVLMTEVHDFLLRLSSNLPAGFADELAKLFVERRKARLCSGPRPTAAPATKTSSMHCWET
jgi:hypothetical protein